MHNPLRSEAEMFRVVVIVALAAAPVIAVGLVFGHLYGAILLAVEVALGIGLAWRSLRGAEEHVADVAETADATHRVLAVANETVTGRELRDELVGRCAGRESEVLVVVPALASTRLAHLSSDVDRELAAARGRLATALEGMARAGIRARGEVGDHHDPNAAIEDALRVFAADEVLISTHPAERSGWLERGVVERARREVPLPVTHVVVDLDAEGSGPRPAGEQAGV